MSSERFAVFCLKKSSTKFGLGPPDLDPMDYGKDGEPEPHLLLRRRRVGLFATREEAEAAMAATAKQMKGNEFYKSHAFIVLACVDRVAQEIAGSEAT